MEEVISEEERRKEERDKRSLFVKGFGKETKEAALKKLHADIVSVRLAKTHAWLIFSTEAACDKAFATINKANVGGGQLQADFCGPKSKHSKHTPKGEFFVLSLERIPRSLPGIVSRTPLL